MLTLRSYLSSFLEQVRLWLLTFVEHGKRAALQVAEDLCRLPAQVLKVGGDVLVHRKSPDLLDRLVLPQQVGLHRQRHSAPISA